MTIGKELRKAAQDPARACERVAKLARATIRSRLPREGQDDVVMFHSGRSGSRVIGDLLDQHPRIYWDREVYHPVTRGRALGAEPMRFLSKRMRRAGECYYGCEIKPVHIHLLRLPLEEVIYLIWVLPTISCWNAAIT